MSKYLSLGSVLYDSTITVDGEYYGEYLGGQGFHALAGMRLWSKDVGLVTRAGEDFRDGFSLWLRDNGVSEDHVQFKLDYTSHVLMQFHEDGSYHPVPHENGLQFIPYLQGIMDPRPEDVEKAITLQTAAYYHNDVMPDRHTFAQHRKIREKYGVRTMWEVGLVMQSSHSASPYFSVEKMRDAAEISGMWSLNRNEASAIYGIPRENDEDMINELMKVPAEMCYYRCGSKGAYVIAGNSAVFCPSIDIGTTVDPMGCGNNSTGTAMAAWCETGGDLLMTAIMAAISAGYNAAQKGPMMLVTDQDMEDARKLAEKYYTELK